MAKVKNLLIGQPPLDSEIQQVIADPTANTTATALKSLISQWMQIVDPNNAEGLTYYEEKMIVFFKLAFQQTQIANTDFDGQFSPQLQPMTNSALLQNAEESFARTVLGLSSFQDAMTTQSFSMTTALKVLYAITDVWQLDDNGKINDTFKNDNKDLQIYVTGKTNIPLSETLDTTDKAHYMHWYVPGLTCTTDPLAAPASASAIYQILTGIVGNKVGASTLFPGCSGGAPLLPPSAYSDWTTVSIRAPNSGEATTTFYDLVNIPSAATLVLNRPYVSFFTTPAFFANWQTNASNQMRVTTNQALIVALGQFVLPDSKTATMMSASPPGLDSDHATSVCRECHEFLDPTRSIFAQELSWSYGFDLQNATIDGDTFASQPGEFAFQQVVRPVASLQEFGGTLATHPLFPAAWVQKLSYYVNSQANDPADPAFTSIVSDFQKSYSWSTLVTNLLASPLTTNTVKTATTSAQGVVVAVARRDHFCSALNFRLGFTDICGLNPSIPVANNSFSKTIAKIAGGLPSDGYGRGSNVPVLPNQPSLFYRAGTENICESVAALVIDPSKGDSLPNVKQWPSTDPTTAITDFVTLIMGITSSNPLYSQAINTLQAHYAAALGSVFTTGTSTTKITAAQALQSTFTAACLSPSFVGLGM